MKECKECGKPVMRSSPRAMFCSRVCKDTSWRKRNRERARAISKAHVHSDGHRDKQYRTKFGITLEDYDQMFADQNGCCDICGVHQSEVKTRFAVDHNHKTGEVRGLLCGCCNKGLGQFKDNTEYLAKAITYLKERTYEQQ